MSNKTPDEIKEKPLTEEEQAPEAAAVVDADGPVIEDVTADFGLLADSGAALDAIAEHVVASHSDDIEIVPLSQLRDEINLLSVSNVAQHNELFAERKKSGDYSMNRWSVPGGVTTAQAAIVLFAREHIVNLVSAKLLAQSQLGTEKGMVLVYDRTLGYYVPLTSGHIASWVKKLSPSATRKYRQDLENLIRSLAQIVTETVDEDIILFNNCGFNYATKERFAFTPDIIRTNKSPVALPETKPAVPMHVMPDGSTKDIFQIMRSWVDSDQNVVQLLQVCGAVLRNYHVWHTSVWLHNPLGKNAKSTYLGMLHNLAGDAATANVPIDEFLDGQFGLDGVQGASLISCGDSDEGVYIARSSRLKQLTEQEALFVNEKNKPHYSMVLHAIMVCAMNALPKFKDKGDSVLARMTIIPFTGRFIGKEKDESIKEWVCSDEVLEYIAYYLMFEMEPYTKILETKETVDARYAHKIDNDPIYDWLINDRHERVFYTFDMAYEAYSRWLAGNRPSTKVMGSTQFKRELKNTVELNDAWSTVDKSKPLSASKWGCRCDYYDLRDPRPAKDDRRKGIVLTSVRDYCLANSVTPFSIAQPFLPAPTSRKTWSEAFASAFGIDISEYVA